MRKERGKGGREREEGEGKEGRGEIRGKEEGRKGGRKHCLEETRVISLNL